MKNLFIALFAMSLPALALATNGDDKTTYKVNAEASSITWNAYKVTGEHEGYINIKDGMVEMKGDKLVGGEFTIDMPSITVTDLEGEMKGKLEGHLKSDDFFGVATYPTAKLKITEVKEKDGAYHVKGKLTIKEKTHPIDFMANITNDGGNMEASTELTVDRSKYDVRYGSKSFFDNLGDKAIYDNFDLKVNLVFSKATS